MYRLALADDPQLWMPGETITVKVSAGIPVAASGSYEVLLRLPDAGANLKNRPEYAVRFANQGLWEPETGMNSLKWSLDVDRKTKGERFRGASWFK